MADASPTSAGRDTLAPDDIDFLKEALHRTRQRVDLLTMAVRELLPLVLGELEIESMVAALEGDDTANLSMLYRSGRSLEPDDLEVVGEPYPIAEWAARCHPTNQPSAGQARLAGARRAYDGADAFEGQRDELEAADD